MKSIFALQEYIDIILEGDYREGRGWGGTIGYFFGGMQIQGKKDFIIVTTACKNAKKKKVTTACNMQNAKKIALTLDCRIQQVFVPITIAKYIQTRA